MGRRAVSLAHLFWEEAESDEEAIDMMREELAEMDKDDLNSLDFEVVDFIEE